MAETAEDPDLLERFRRGDPTAFAAIVERHRRTVYGIARRFLSSHDEADEAVQQAFVRAWQARESFRGDAALSTWLVRITINVTRSMHARRPPVEPLDDLHDPPDESPGAEAGLVLDRARARVRQAVAGLPERQRAVVLLKVFSDMTYAEVARVLELTEGAVKAHLHQAVANLRRRLSAGAGVGR